MRFSEGGAAQSINLNYSGADNANVMGSIPASRLFVNDITVGARHKADARTGAANGAAITTWADSSPNTNNMVGATNSPTFHSSTPSQLINFNPVVDMTEDALFGGDYSSGLMFGSGGRTMFAISRQNSNTDQ